MIFALCTGLILGCLVLLSLTMPIYCVEVGDAKVYFFSKKKADRFYQINVELYENLAELDKELDDIQKLVEARLCACRNAMRDKPLVLEATE